MKILVFVGKKVGLECLSFTLEKFPRDEYVIVLDNSEETELAKYLKGRGVSFLTGSPETLASLPKQYAPAAFDWLLNLWGSSIFRAEHLALAKNSLNIHPSLLPYGRGRDPIVWAIRRGEPAGATLHAITAAVDEGPIWTQLEVPNEIPCRGAELYERVLAACTQLYLDSWAQIREGSIAAKAQPHGKQFSTNRRTHLLKDREIHLEESPDQESLVRALLAHDFSPGYTAKIHWDGKVFSATLNLQEIKE